jgi:ABC-type polysaccharide/polyol phosphate transport system ATPase subunit
MILARDVGVRFLFDRQRRVVTPAAARLRRFGAETWGLRNVSFQMDGGYGYALLGRSGSGKTTLLRLLASVLYPDQGSLEISGRVGSLLSIDAGLLALLTGRENALHLGVLAGLSRAQSRRALEQVKERSALGDYFERPVSSYSQGMRARLGLAVADERDPNILLLDEVHEALDHEFRTLLERRAEEIVGKGGIVVAAGHDHEMLRRLCTRGLFLDDGTLQSVGEFETVRARYLAHVDVAEDLAGDVPGAAG